MKKINEKSKQIKTALAIANRRYGNGPTKSEIAIKKRALAELDSKISALKNKEDQSNLLKVKSYAEDAITLLHLPSYQYNVFKFHKKMRFKNISVARVQYLIKMQCYSYLAGNSDLLSDLAKKVFWATSTDEKFWYESTWECLANLLQSLFQWKEGEREPYILDRVSQHNELKGVYEKPFLKTLNRKDVKECLFDLESLYWVFLALKILALNIKYEDLTINQNLRDCLEDAGDSIVNLSSEEAKSTILLIQSTISMFFNVKKMKKPTTLKYLKFPYTF